MILALLAPHEHYIPVSSTLANLSAAVLWAREHDGRAVQIARSAAELMREVVSVGGLSACPCRGWLNTAMWEAHSP